MSAGRLEPHASRPPPPVKIRVAIYNPVSPPPQIRDAESGHSMFELCELAPTRWCLLGLAATLRRSAVPGGPSLQRVADRLRTTATDMMGDDCRRPDADVILALKVGIV